MSMTAEQIRKGYQNYCCKIKSTLSIDPVRLIKHPILKQRRNIYDHEAIVTHLNAKHICMYTRVSLTGEHATLESALLETLIFALEAKKSLHKLNPDDGDDAVIIEEFKSFFDQIAESKPAQEMLKRAEEIMNKLAKDDRVDLPIDIIATLLTLGVPGDYEQQKLYADEKTNAEAKILKEAEERKQTEEKKQKELLNQQLRNAQLELQELEEINRRQAQQLEERRPLSSIEDRSNQTTRSPSSNRYAPELLEFLKLNQTSLQKLMKHAIQTDDFNLFEKLLKLFNTHSSKENHNFTLFLKLYLFAKKFQHGDMVNFLENHAEKLTQSLDDNIVKSIQDLDLSNPKDINPREMYLTLSYILKMLQEFETRLINEQLLNHENTQTHCPSNEILDFYLLKKGADVKSNERRLSLDEQFNAIVEGLYDIQDNRGILSQHNLIELLKIIQDHNHPENTVLLEALRRKHSDKDDKKYRKS